jgi:hypothetical protein
VALFLLVRNIQRGRVARSFFAIRDSETTAVSMGIDPVRYKLVAFGLAGMIGGIAGSLLAYVKPSIQPIDYFFTASLTWVLATVLSSITVLGGAVLAGFLFSVLPQLIASPTSGVNQAPVILGGISAILTVTDYPNGLASFFSRLVRPFDPGESIAWASAEDGDVNPAAARAEADHHDDDFALAGKRGPGDHGGGHDDDESGTTVEFEVASR